MAKKNLLVPLTGTVVIRDGKRVRPPVGTPFQFQGDEVEQLKSGGAKFRLPTNETAGTDEDEDEGTGVQPSAEASQAQAKGGKKKATAAKSDKENDDDGDGNAPADDEDL